MNPPRYPALGSVDFGEKPGRMGFNTKAVRIPKAQFTARFSRRQQTGSLVAKPSQFLLGSTSCQNDEKSAPQAVVERVLRRIKMAVPPLFCPI
jgi:hypothetical protein